MAKYQITEAVYVNSKYLGQFARPNDPATIEVPDDHEPGRGWIPLDEVAQKALLALGKKRVAQATEGLDPVKDKSKIERITIDTMRPYTKAIPQATTPKVEVREINTNAEMAEQRAKVVGRNADKSPV